MSVKKQLTVFMHIPKTGGTTLQNIVSRFYKKESCLHVSSPLAPLREIAIEHSQQHSPFLIKGHLGLNEVKNIPGSFIFTFLRPPIPRIISHYYFLKEQPSVKHYELLNRPETTIESFYALAEKKDIDNCLTRYLSGAHQQDFGKIGEENFLEALENLEHKIDFFGMQENYDESLILLANKLNWSLPIYRKKNLTRKKELVSEQTLEFLKEANHWDILLFEKAQKIFAKKINEMTSAEKRKLSRLRFLNKIAGAVPF